ncbi:hypothetical protein VT84_17615 [Gemmata sp. SH-PL17]|nr:hypothetical protein VT84_17615 [Gemmata sp. SH-PL17]
MKKYRVTLTAEERESLGTLVATGKAAAKKLIHARILLKADQADSGPAWTDNRSPRRWTSALPPSSGFGSGSSSKGWNRPWSARSRTSPAGSVNSTGPARRA